MVTRVQYPLPPPSVALVDPRSGLITPEWYDYLRSQAQALPGFSAHKNGVDQTGIASGVYTPLTWSTESYDLGSWFDGNAFTARANGRVQLLANVRGSGSIANGAIVTLAIFKNGVEYKSTQWEASKAGVQTVTLLLLINDSCVSGDVYDVRINPTLSAGTFTVSGNQNLTRFSGNFDL